MNNEIKINRQSTISGLHYLRALATLMVVIVHAFNMSALPWYYNQHQFNGFFDFGAGEIDLFFMMSGFIMVVVTHDKTTKLPRLTAVEFFKRRAIRILPMLWISVVSYALLRYLGRDGSLDLASSVRALVLWPVGRLDPNVAWTIRHEVLFYIIFGTLFLCYRRFIFLALLWFVSPLILAVTTGDWLAHPDTLAKFFFSSFNIEFGIGVCLGYLYLTNASAPKFFKYQLPSMILILAVLRAFLYFTDIGPLFGTLPFILSIAPFACALVILATRTEPTRISKTMIFFGDASYSIFLFHPHVVSAVLGILTKLHVLPGWAGAVVAATAGILAGSLIHVLVERPVLKHAGVMLHSIPNLRKRIFRLDASGNPP